MMRGWVVRAVLGWSLALPGALYASPWYGWDNVCSSYSSLPEISPFSVCASVQIRTHSVASGGTRVDVRMQYTSSEPVLWGGPRALIFSEIEGATDPLSEWYDPPYLAYWLLDEPTEGHWLSFTFDAPFTMRHTDLVGFYGQLYNEADYFRGPTAEFDVYLSDPHTVVPEPSTLLLLATGLLAIGGAGVWRRGKDEAQGHDTAGVASANPRR